MTGLVRRMRRKQAGMLHGLVALGENSHDTNRGLQAMSEVIKREELYEGTTNYKVN